MIPTPGPTPFARLRSVGELWDIVFIRTVSTDTCWQTVVNLGYCFTHALPPHQSHEKTLPAAAFIAALTTSPRNGSFTAMPHRSLLVTEQFNLINNNPIANDGALR